MDHISALKQAVAQYRTKTESDLANLDAADNALRASQGELKALRRLQMWLDQPQSLDKLLRASKES